MTSRIITGTNNGGYGILIAADGSLSEPAYSFVNDPDTGIYSVSANNLGFVAGGALVFKINSDALYAQNGTASTPTYSFLSNSNTGMYQDGAARIGFATGGTERFLITSDQTRAMDGTTALPAFSFITDFDTGMYRFANDELGFVAGGVRQVEMRASYVRFQVPAAFQNGTPALPSIRFENSSDTGFHLKATNVIGVSAGSAAARLVFDSDGIKALNGSAPAPSFSFINDINTGIYSPSNNADEIAFSTAGNLRANINNSGIRSSNGAVGTPSFSFISDTNTGMYSGGLDIIGFATNGLNRLTITNSKVDLATQISMNGNVLDMGGGTFNTSGGLIQTSNGNVDLGTGKITGLAGGRLGAISGNAFRVSYTGGRIRFFIDNTEIASLPAGYAP